MSELFLSSQLELSTFTTDDDDGTDSAPLIAPPSGHALLEKFADLTRFLTGDPTLSDVATQQQLRRVLKLVAVLWGPLPTDVDPGKFNVCCKLKCFLQGRAFSFKIFVIFMIE